MSNKPKTKGSNPPSQPQGKGVSLPEVRHTSIKYSGPLPPASELEKYDHVLPGLAERIISLTEKEQIHRHAIETEAVRAETLDMEKARLEARIGQIFAFAIALLAIGGGIYCTITGHPVAGPIISSGGLVMVVTAFIKGRQEKENEQKGR